MTEDQKAEASKAKGAVRSEEVVTVEDTSPSRTTTVEKKKGGWGLHGLPLPKQRRLCA